MHNYCGTHQLATMLALELISLPSTGFVWQEPCRISQQDDLGFLHCGLPLRVENGEKRCVE